MTDNLFENFNNEHNDDYKENFSDTPSVPEKSAEPLVPEETTDSFEAKENESAPQAKEETSGATGHVYTDIYADSSAYRSAAQPTQQAQPDQAYVNPYRQTVTEPKRETPSYNDGFYHQSYVSQTGGNNVNYTRPVQNTAQPQQHYASGVSSRPQQRYAYAAPTQEPLKERKKKSGGVSKGAVAVILVICVLISGAAGFGGSILASKLNQASYDTAGNTMVIHKVDTDAEVAGTEALVDKTTAEITTEVADTVVEITTEVMQTNSFYGQYIAQGAGSGVIISGDGYILTNNHVIDGASSIKVTTRGGDSYDAKLVGTDSKVDIALLKIEANDLPTAVFGDSSALTVGSKAVIIGNPLGTLGGSVTEGIISALDRSIVIDGKTMHLMQTDAAINPGNSGGGMFNGQGELSGIVVAKSSSEEIDNIGFVIPINNVLDILGDLKDYGYVRGRADTGMTFIDLTNQMYAYYYYGNNSAGVYISSVESGSNADKSGFRQGDRVVSVDGKEISSADEITRIISEKSAGDTVTFELNRGGSSGKLELTLEEEVPEAQKSAASNNDSGNGFSQDNDPFGGSDPFGGLFGR